MAVNAAACFGFGSAHSLPLWDLSIAVVVQLGQAVPSTPTVLKKSLLPPPGDASCPRSRLCHRVLLLAAVSHGNRLCFVSLVFL